MRLQHVLAHTLLLILAVLERARGAQDNYPSQKRVPKQIHATAKVVDTEEDHKSAETHFGGGGAGIGGHGKYFMDTYKVEIGPKQVEFGHVCENPDDWEQRYERKDEENKRYQGKVRWGDKHGGYGEHYWDYNHGGHGHGDGDEGGSNDEGSDGGYSDPVPDYQQSNKQSEGRVKRQHSDADTASSASSSDTESLPSLVYDIESGTVVNEATGQRYLLTPIN